MNKFSHVVLFFIFAGLIILYFLTMPLTATHNRYTMYLLNTRTGKEGTEARYVLKTGTKSNEVQFVEELMLGAMNHDFSDFFAKDTKLETCFVDGDTLYVSFPKTVLTDVQEKMSFETFYTMFQKNIFKNFPQIKNVCIFLDGVQVYAK